MDICSFRTKATRMCWLVYMLSLREFHQRYRGSFFGPVWPFLYIFIQIALYGTVFTVIFKVRWQQTGVGIVEDALPFWLILFAGQVVFSFISDILNSSPKVILGVPNYVKKIIFPLALLPVVNVIVSLFILFINLFILIVCAGYFGCLSWTILSLPLVLAQIVLWSLGIGWIFGALGVFFRDLSHFANLFSQLLMFATPIFYSMDSVPQRFRYLLAINPLVNIVEDVRNVLLWGKQPDLLVCFFWTALASIFAWGSFVIFNHLRHTFADVL
jgi:lipopolysaccharide transport system permease protein